MQYHFHFNTPQLEVNIPVINNIGCQYLNEFGVKKM